VISYKEVASQRGKPVLTWWRAGKLDDRSKRYGWARIDREFVLFVDSLILSRVVYTHHSGHVFRRRWEPSGFCPIESFEDLDRVYQEKTAKDKAKRVTRKEYEAAVTHCHFFKKEK
jgi:hypothetical protein